MCFNPVVAKLKIVGNIIELHKPINKTAHMATAPEVNVVTNSNTTAAQALKARTLPAGTKYQIWTAFFTQATLHYVGTATVDGNGHLVSDTDALVQDLTTIILIPDVPQENGTDAGMIDLDASVALDDSGVMLSNTNTLDAGN